MSLRLRGTLTSLECYALSDEKARYSREALRESVGAIITTGAYGVILLFIVIETACHGEARTLGCTGFEEGA